MRSRNDSVCCREIENDGPSRPSLEGSNEGSAPRRVRRPSTGLRTRRQEFPILWPLLPSQLCQPVQKYGHRSCSPLRDSSGFAPDSHGLRFRQIDDGSEPSILWEYVQLRDDADKKISILRRQICPSNSWSRFCCKQARFVVMRRAVPGLTRKGGSPRQSPCGLRR
jgi:hypothetical protein